MSKTKERIEKYIALAKAATPGPWSKNQGEVEDKIGHTVAQAFSTPALDGRSLFERKVANAEFIASSRTEGEWCAKMLLRAIEVLEQYANKDMQVGADRATVRHCGVRTISIYSGETWKLGSEAQDILKEMEK